jgi:hypothetical protein
MALCEDTGQQVLIDPLRCKDGLYLHLPRGRWVNGCSPDGACFKGEQTEPADPPLGPCCPALSTLSTLSALPRCRCRCRCRWAARALKWPAAHGLGLKSFEV